MKPINEQASHGMKRVTKKDKRKREDRRLKNRAKELARRLRSSRYSEKNRPKSGAKIVQPMSKKQFGETFAILAGKVVLLSENKNATPLKGQALRRAHHQHLVECGLRNNSQETIKKKDQVWSVQPMRKKQFGETFGLLAGKVVRLSENKNATLIKGQALRRAHHQHLVECGLHSNSQDAVKKND